MSYAKLRGRIKEKYCQQTSFAKAMEMDSASLSAKLNRKRQWKHNEIAKACELLDIPLEQVAEYFFTE